MSLPYQLFIALRYFKPKKRESISLLDLLSFGAVAIILAILLELFLSGISTILLMVIGAAVVGLGVLLRLLLRLSFWAVAIILVILLELFLSGISTIIPMIIGAAVVGLGVLLKLLLRVISLNTLISVGGVALGVTALTTVLSVMGGFRDDLQSKILGVNAHIVVLNYTGKIKDHESLRENINRIQGVSSTSPVVYGQAMLGFGDRANGVMIRGIEPEIESETTDVLEFIKEGSVEDFIENSSDLPGIAVGRGLARNLGLFVGDEITMISPVGDIGPMGMLPKMKKFKVEAIFEVGMYEYDSSLALVNMADAQEFFKLDGEVTGIEVKVGDIYNSKKIAAEIENSIGSPYYARDWMEMNRNLFSALELEKYVMFLILVLVVLVACFNIISNLIMIVMEKAREIAVIKAMGATKEGIMLIFMIHGLIIGVIGTTIGLASGYVLCRLLETYQFINLPSDVYYLSYLPVRVSMIEFIVVAFTAVFISFMATIYPSWQAAKMDPVEPLRYE